MKVPDCVSRIASGTSGMSYALARATVRLSMRIFLYFSEITICPLYVVNSGLPVEIGTDLTVCPSRTTFMVCVSASTVDTWERPIVKLTVFSCTPVTLLAPLTPSRSIFIVTLEPAFQYSSGRKSRRCAPNQCPTTCCPLLDVTVMCDCTAFLSLIALSKLNDTGIPTPTVVPLSGVYVPTKLFALDTVVKTDFAVTDLPSESFAVAAIRYLVPRSNCSVGFQPLPPAAIDPGTSWPVPASVIFTPVSVPSLTFTPVELIDAPVEPFLAEMVISAAEVFAGSLPPLHSLSASEPPPHAVRVRAPTIRTAQAPSERRAAMSGVVTKCSRFM